MTDLTIRLGPSVFNIDGPAALLAKAAAGSATQAQGFRDEAEGEADRARAEIEDVLNGVIIRGGGALINGLEPLGVIGAEDALGAFRVFLAMMPDGTIRSQAIQALVDARLSGFTFTSANVAGYIFAITQEGPDGKSYILAGLRDDGTWYPGGSGGGIVVLYHIPFHGQSNAMADEARPVISTTATGYGNLRFQRGVATWSSIDNPNTPASRAASGFELVPLTAQTVETRANALADHFKGRLIGVSRYSAEETDSAPFVLMSSASLGGRKLTELGPENHGDSGEVGARPPGGFWATLKDDILRAKAQAESRGWQYNLPFWNWDQGEGEGDLKLYINGAETTPSLLIAGYKSRFLTMIEDLDTFVRAQTGKNAPTPCLITPPCFNLLTPTAMLDACDESELAVMIGPRYQMPTALESTPRGDRIHYNADGQRWIGEMAAKVGHRVMIEGEAWQPLRALFAAKSGNNTVDVTFHVPRPPLVIDERTWPRVRGWGFRIYSGSLDSKANVALPTGIEMLPGGNGVRLTFASAVPAGALLEIGAQSVMPQLTALTVTSVGSTTLNGAAAYSLTITGNLVALVSRALRNGTLQAFGNGPSFGLIRSVSLNSGNTVLVGENSELRFDGGRRAFQAGDVIELALSLPCTNLRDSDNAASFGSFVSGPRTGEPYPLQNWLCQYDGLAVEGA